MYETDHVQYENRNNQKYYHAETSDFSDVRSTIRLFFTWIPTDLRKSESKFVCFISCVRCDRISFAGEGVGAVDCTVNNSGFVLFFFFSYYVCQLLTIVNSGHGRVVKKKKIYIENNKIVYTII